MINQNGSNIWCRCGSVIALLLVILAEILASLLLSREEFLHPEMPLLIKPGIHFNAVLHVCQLTPVVFLSFACLSILFATYGRTGTLFRLSAALQAVSWLIILHGLAGYMFLKLRYSSWELVAPWFYAYAAIQVELVVPIYLTLETGRRISPDWEMLASSCPHKTLEL